MRIATILLAASGSLLLAACATPEPPPPPPPPPGGVPGSMAADRDGDGIVDGYYDASGMYHPNYVPPPPPPPPAPTTKGERG